MGPSFGLTRRDTNKPADSMKKLYLVRVDVGSMFPTYDFVVEAVGQEDAERMADLIVQRDYPQSVQSVEVAEKTAKQIISYLTLEP